MRCNIIKLLGRPVESTPTPNSPFSGMINVLLLQNSNSKRLPVILYTNALSCELACPPQPPLIHQPITLQNALI